MTSPLQSPETLTQFARYPSLFGQTAFVSGGATGLGAEFVRQLAAQGVRVAFVDLNAAAGHTLSQQIQSRGAHYEAVGHVLLGGQPPVFL